MEDVLLRRAAAGAAALSLGAILGCASVAATAGSGGPETDYVDPYPAGRWRLAPREDLAQVVLWVSHILIRHSDVTPGVVSFHLPDWTPEHARPMRTREEAFALARSLAERLQEHPEAFAQVAREASEDPATRAIGGSLGGITALEWHARYPQVLDSLAALEPGSVSRVVETRHGFHVFLRRRPPPSETVSGARIVIAYDEAPWLAAFHARRDVPRRTRAQALALAEAIHSRIRAGEGFASLVEAYSDHEDALRGGDFGEWSTRRPTPYPREVEILQALEVGAVAPPLDSPFGVEIIGRTRNRPRQLYAMSAIEQLYAGPVKGSELPAQEALREEMSKLAAEVIRDPARFAGLQQEYCCTAIQQWSEGQGSAFAEQALAPLAPGQVAPAVVQLHGAYAIVRREAPTAQAEAGIAFDLPSPSRPDLRYLAGTGFLAARLDGASAPVSAALRLEEPQQARLAEMHERSRRFMDEAESADERIRRYDELLEEVRALLGAQGCDAYVAQLERHYTGLLLRK